MSIRIWMFIALMAIALMGVGGVSAAHAEQDINDLCDSGGSRDDSAIADCLEDQREEEEEEKRIADCEANTMATNSDIESFLVNCPEFMPTEEITVYEDVPTPEDEWEPALPWDSSEPEPASQNSCDPNDIKSSMPPHQRGWVDRACESVCGEVPLFGGLCQELCEMAGEGNDMHEELVRRGCIGDWRATWPY